MSLIDRHDADMDALSMDEMTWDLIMKHLSPNSKDSQSHSDDNSSYPSDSSIDRNFGAVVQKIQDIEKSKVGYRCIARELVGWLRINK